MDIRVSYTEMEHTKNTTSIVKQLHETTTVFLTIVKEAENNNETDQDRYR